jgi:hypothetical protein
MAGTGEIGDPLTGADGPDVHGIPQAAGRVGRDLLSVDWSSTLPRATELVATEPADRRPTQHGKAVWCVFSIPGAGPDRRPTRR